MKYILFLIIILSSCGSYQENVVQIMQIQENKVELNKDSIFKFKMFNSKQYIYINDSLLQTIFINDNGENRIYFQYYTFNASSGCKDSIEGIAVNIYPDNDPEIDEDEEGVGYPAIQYNYELEGVRLAIRQSMNEKDKIKVLFTGIRNSKCNYASVGILNLVLDNSIKKKQE